MNVKRAPNMMIFFNGFSIAMLQGNRIKSWH